MGEYQSIETHVVAEVNRRTDDDRPARRRKFVAALVMAIAGLGVASYAGVVELTCPCHGCCHATRYIPDRTSALDALGVWVPFVSDAGASQPHPWVGNEQNSGNDYQLGTGTNCVDPLAAPVLGGVDVVAYWRAEDERANAT